MDYELETHYLDIGQGDCSIIIVRNTEYYTIERVVVYDCGSGSGVTAGLKLLQKCKSLSIEKIDVAVISHFDRDHFNGFTTLFQSAVKNNPFAAEVQQLFRDTIVYSQGCIFQKYQNEKVDKKTIDKFLSAYYFKDGYSSSMASILRDYTDFLDATYALKKYLNKQDRSSKTTKPNKFNHATERMLAGFPDRKSVV